MADGLRDALHQAAAAPRREVDPATIAAAGRRRRRRRHLATATLSLVLVAVVAVAGLGLLEEPDLAFGPDEQTVFEVPLRGEVRPEWLGDGTPVFVVHHDDGQASVVEAESTHDPLGLGKVVGWCASSRTFDDMVHASQWGAYGNWLTGPAPTGLPTYTVQRDGDTVRVQARTAPASRTPREDTPAPTQQGPSCGWPDKGTLLGARDRTFHDVDRAPVPVRRPGELGDDGRVVVQGTIVQRHDRPAQLCATPEGEPPECPPGSPELVDVEPAPGLRRTVTGRFMVTAADGQLRDVVMFPDVKVNSAETGGPQQGSDPGDPTRGPWDTDAELRPDLMRLEPAEVAAGEHVKAFFPEETERGVGYVLEQSVNGSWETQFCLTAAWRREGATWSPLEGCGWDAVGRDGSGPDWLIVPEPAEPGSYRICTANSPENICAELQVTAPASNSA